MSSNRGMVTIIRIVSPEQRDTDTRAAQQHTCVFGGIRVKGFLEEVTDVSAPQIVQLNDDVPLLQCDEA